MSPTIEIESVDLDFFCIIVRLNDHKTNNNIQRIFKHNDGIESFRKLLNDENIILNFYDMYDKTNLFINGLALGNSETQRLIEKIMLLYLDEIIFDLEMLILDTEKEQINQDFKVNAIYKKLINGGK